MNTVFFSTNRLLISSIINVAGFKKKGWRASCHSSLSCTLKRALFQAFTQAIDQTNGDGELILQSGTAEIRESRIGRDAKGQTRRTVQINLSTECAAECKLIAEQAEAAR